MFAGCMVSLFFPLLLWAFMRPFIRKPYNWDDLFYMVPLQPRASDLSFTPEDDEGLGVDYDPVELARASTMAKIVTAVLCLIFLIIIPFPLYGTGYVMSRKFFTGWTVVVFIWSWCAALFIWCVPIWQSREPFGRVIKGIFGDISGKRRTVGTAGSAVEIETPSNGSGDEMGLQSTEKVVGNVVKKG